MTLNNVYYLNNTGSRWIDKTPDAMRFLLIDGDIKKIRKCDFYESFGNFASINFRYNGKRYSRLASERVDGLPAVFLDINKR